MLLCVPDVLTKDEVAHCRSVMEAAAWQDGRETAGAQAAQIKLNMQLPADSQAARELGQIILDGLYKSPLFLSAALPSRIMPPMFNSYSGGQTFGVHVDNAIRSVPGQAARIRTDLSATLFLAEPEEYEGGELMIETLYGSNEVKLPAGHMVLYPATSLHCVTPVTAGLRRASIFWVQSMIREEGPRTMLFDLDRTIQELQGERGLDDPQSVRLAGIYHNLIRHWAET